MTNEQLAILIKQGENNELIPLLWDKIKRLMYVKSERAYRLYKDSCEKAGITALDIKQSCYEAFLKALEGYNPNKEYPFVSYLKYPFKTAFNSLIGIRGKNNPLNDCTSLDIPLKDTEDLTFKDTVLDDFNLEESVTEYVGAEQLKKILWSEVENLSQRESNIITSRYKSGNTQQMLAKKLNISGSRVAQIEQSALRKLRGSVELRKIADAYGYDSYKIYCSSLCRFKASGLSYVEEIAINRADFMQRERGVKMTT